MAADLLKRLLIFTLAVAIGLPPPAAYAQPRRPPAYQILEQGGATRALEGRWEATGYSCDSSTPAVELLDLKYDPFEGWIEAHKVTGDNCIPAGEVSFRGWLSPEGRIDGEMHISDGPFGARRWISASYQLSGGVITGMGLTVRRAAPPPAPRGVPVSIAVQSFQRPAVAATKPMDFSVKEDLEFERPFRIAVRYNAPPAERPVSVRFEWNGGGANLPLAATDNPLTFATAWHRLAAAAEVMGQRPRPIAEANTPRSLRTAGEHFQGRWTVTQSGWPGRGAADVGPDGSVRLVLQADGETLSYRATEVLALAGAEKFLEARFNEAADARAGPLQPVPGAPPATPIAVNTAMSGWSAAAGEMRISGQFAAPGVSRPSLYVLLRGRDGGRLAGQAQLQYQDGKVWKEGQQTWSRGAVIEGALALDNQLGVDNVGRIDLSTAYPWQGQRPIAGRKTTRTLFVWGRNLPNSAGDAIQVEGADGVRYQLEALGDERHGQIEEGWRKSGVTDRREKNALLLRATLPPGALPGPKTFSLNGTPGVWLLDYADALGALHFAHDWHEGEYPRTETLYASEFAFVVVEDQGGVPRDSLEIDLTLKGRPVAGPLVARRTPNPDGLGHTYRSPPLRLIWRAASDFRPPARPGAVDVEVGVGDTLEARLRDPLVFRTLPEQASARIIAAPGELGATWRDALSRMSACYPDARGDIERMTSAQAEAYSRFTITDKLPWVRSAGSLRISRGDHAAAILIRDETVQMVRESLPAWRSLAQVDAATFARLRSQAHRFASVRARTPDGSDTTLQAVLSPDARFAWRMDERRADAFALREARRALEAFIGDMEASASRAAAIPDCSLLELMAVSGQRADGPVARLLPRLVRLDTTGGGKSWVRDPMAEAHVKGLRTLGEAMRALDDYARLDDSYKAMAVALVTAGAAAGLSAAGYGAGAAYAAIGGDAADMLVFGGKGVADYYAGRSTVDLMRGLTPALGDEALAEAEAASSKWYEAALGVLAPGVGLGSGVRGLRQVRNAQAATRGAALADRLSRLEPSAISRMTDAQRLDLAAAYTDLQVRRLRDGASSLTEAERARLAKFDRYFDPPAAAPPLAAAPRPVMARPAPATAAPARPVAVASAPAEAPSVRSAREAPAPAARADAPPARGAGLSGSVEDATPTVRLPPPADNAPAVRAGREATAPTVRAEAPTVRNPGRAAAAVEDATPTVRLQPRGDNAPTVRTGREATAPTVRAEAPTVRNPRRAAAAAKDVTPTVRLQPRGDNAPTVRTGREATAPTVRAEAPTVRNPRRAAAAAEDATPTVGLQPRGDNAPTVRTGREAAAPTVRAEAPTVRNPGGAAAAAEDVTPTVRLQPRGDNAPTVRTGREATAPTVRAEAPTARNPGRSAAAAEDATPTVRLQPRGDNTPTVRTGREATAPTVRAEAPTVLNPGRAARGMDGPPTVRTARDLADDTPTARFGTPDPPPSAAPMPASLAPASRSARRAETPTPAQPVRYTPPRGPPPAAPPPHGQRLLGEGAEAGQINGVLRLQDKSVDISDWRGGRLNVEVGEQLGGGSANILYRVRGDDNVLLRVSKFITESPSARFDAYGRATLERLTRPGGPLDGALEVTRAQVLEHVTSRTEKLLNGRTVLLVDNIKSKHAAGQIADQGGRMTPGQIIAYDKAIRALNRQNYALIDGHDHNFFFRRLSPDRDEWVMQLFDPGGVVPLKSPGAARRMQALVEAPPGDWPENLSRQHAVWSEEKQRLIQEMMTTELDQAALGLRADELRFKPEGLEHMPGMRDLFQLSDAEAAAAYARLRAGGPVTAPPRSRRSR